MSHTVNIQFMTTKNKTHKILYVLFLKKLFLFYIMITKEDFVKIVDLYHPTMRYYQLIKLYFSIVDKSNPYFYKAC